MTQKSFYTVGQLSELFDVPEWKIRRVVDSFGDTIPRAGQYRLVPAEMLDAVAKRLGVKAVEVAG